MPFPVFPTSVSRWFLSGVWLNASLQDSFQYSGQSQQCCSLDGLHFFCYFQVLQSLCQYFSNCTKSTNYNYTFMFHCFFNSISYCCCRYRRLQFSKFPFCLLLLGLVDWTRLGDPFLFQNPPWLCTSYSPGQTLSCAYTICPYGQFKFLAQFPVDHLAHPVVSSLIIFFLC